MLAEHPLYRGRKGIEHAPFRRGVRVQKHRGIGERHGSRCGVENWERKGPEGPGLHVPGVVSYVAGLRTKERLLAGSSAPS